MYRISDIHVYTFCYNGICYVFAICFYHKSGTANYPQKSIDYHVLSYDKLCL